MSGLIPEAMHTVLLYWGENKLSGPFFQCSLLRQRLDADFFGDCSALKVLIGTKLLFTFLLYGRDVSNASLRHVLSAVSVTARV